LKEFKNILLFLNSFIFDFSTKKFFGNPYNFSASSTQSIVFDIPDSLENIQAIRYEFYQNDNFKNNQGDLILSSYKDSLSNK